MEASLFRRDTRDRFHPIEVKTDSAGGKIRVRPRSETKTIEINKGSVEEGGIIFEIADGTLNGIGVEHDATDHISSTNYL